LYLIKDSFRAFYPKLSVPQAVNAPLIKRFIWAINEWKTTWFSPILKAKRRGTIDYFFRNFVDCPESIRKLNNG